jgi:hypothetical protein
MLKQKEWEERGKKRKRGEKLCRLKLRGVNATPSLPLSLSQIVIWRAIAQLPLSPSHFAG